MAIGVLLADDHGVLRDGLRRLLESHHDINVVGAVADGLEAIGHAEQLRPHVVVMDISMPGLNGIEATRSISARVPDAGIVILSMHSSPDVIQRALSAGARGFLLKESVGDEVVAAIRTIAAGGRYLSRAIAAGGDPARGGAAAPVLDDLTQAEQQILRLVVEGNTSAGTAQLLGLSPRTVETYRSRLMEKLQLNDLPALVRFAIRNGVTPLG
jgi:DNA-binding NarL/FixJ family response regulator